MKCLLDIQDNVVCPIKLLLIHALRLGRVQGKSIDEVLSKARIRPDKQIVWTDGQAPIFCAITSSGAGLLVDKPASNQQAKHFVAQAGQLCGVLGSIITDDIRRGCARDTAQRSERSREISYLSLVLSIRTIHCYTVFTILPCALSYALSFTFIRTAGQLLEL